METTVESCAFEMFRKNNNIKTENNFIQDKLIRTKSKQLEINVFKISILFNIHINLLTPKYQFIKPICCNSGLINYTSTKNYRYKVRNKKNEYANFVTFFVF